MTIGKYAARSGIILGLVVLSVSLVGCGRKSDSNRYGQLEPPLNSGAADGQFGSRFEEASRADPNSEPMNVVDGDLPPADPTKEPAEVN